MGRKKSFVCMALGTILMVAGILLHRSNLEAATMAETAAAQVLPQIITHIEVRETMPTEAAPIPIPSHMATAEIDGYRYIGYLSIPGLELELPVMADWDYSRLKLSPCRYAGSLWEDDLVIMAHNYSHHFGRLSSLSPGDKLFFTDMNGLSTEYQVSATDILEPTAVEEVTENEYDLTLFTCTYGGQNRITVFCSRVISQ